MRMQNSNNLCKGTHKKLLAYLAIATGEVNGHGRYRYR